MAQHVRTDIRDAVATAITGLAATGSRVFKTRAYAVPAADMPCLLVYVPSEDSSKPVFCHPGELQRIIQISIDGMKTQSGDTADLEDDLNAIAAQVEVALAADFTLGGLVKDLQIVHTEIQIQGGDSPKPTGTIRMTWQVKAATREGVPGTAL